MDFFRYIGKVVVNLTLWILVTWPPYLVLAVFVGVNPWIAVAVVLFNMYAAGLYWFLAKKIQEAH